jgi:isobutyryl-CoA mutase
MEVLMKTVGIGDLYHPKNKVRMVTAASLFDGHDAAINIMRRLFQKGGAEVIHLGHNIAAKTLAKAALEEDAHAVCLSSYQGGHLEYFKYLRQLLDESGAKHIKIFGGGGGVILPTEIKELEAVGIERIYSPEDGQVLGLDGIISDCLKRSDFSLPSVDTNDLSFRNPLGLARGITELENTKLPGESKLRTRLIQGRKKIPVLGITGTGGSGKSSLTDELLSRFLHSVSNIKVGIVCVDPTRKKTGGALLGDRIRMNALEPDRTYMRSLATRDSQTALSQSIEDAILVLKNSDADLILVETSGIGQGDTGITSFSDATLYVMTPEYGASTQLEKIGMLDLADFIAVNKLEKRGGEDALRDVKKQYCRNHDLPFGSQDLPVIGTTASQFNNQGVSELYRKILEHFSRKGFFCSLEVQDQNFEIARYSTSIVPAVRSNYLGEIADTVRAYHRNTKNQAGFASNLYCLKMAKDLLQNSEPLDEQVSNFEEKLSQESTFLLEQYREDQKQYRQERLTYEVRGREFSVDLKTKSLSGLQLPRVALPKFLDWGDRLSFMRRENLPGRFPYTAGVFPFKRVDEDPKRQFAGEGGPLRTNERFHYLSQDTSKRLSVAFDSVTLYGEDPENRPDIYGKIGEAGVSISTIEDMQTLFSGFDLVAKNTSVSMTINGPAPIILAMYFNTAILQQINSGDKISESDYERVCDETLQAVRGTVQADILKEDQAQNTCIFSVDFALKMMGDIQEYFTAKSVRNFYSVSISGYHIAEAGANPVTQCALTLANGFTFVEAYLARGLSIDEFAPNLSFFFSNGMDCEYAVIGRVARRIWAIAMREKYGAGDRSQKLKYHIQTSGRSLHAQEIQFNDIRTTLQALMAVYDNCNSLHTNAYDEAITTPTEESVRRAMAIQMIISKELGLSKNENILQGSFIINELTDLVEEAICSEFDRISSRGGVLGAMETQYQRAKIQEESMLYEQQKSSGALPIIGVNTFLDESAQEKMPVAVSRASYDEKDDQIQRLKQFQEKHTEKSGPALKKLRQVALSGENIFAELMETVKYCSLSQITQTLYAVGGQYRRSM